MNGAKYTKKYREKPHVKQKNRLTNATGYDTINIHTVLVCPFGPPPRVDIVAQDGEDVKWKVRQN